MNKLFALAAVAILSIAINVPSQAGRPGDNIVDTAIFQNGPDGDFTGQLDILIAALGAADPAVIATLSGSGQYTVFAPIDAAFEAANITEANVGDLDQLALTQVLQYHVARGNLKSNAVVGKSSIRTLLGESLAVAGTVLTDLLGRNANIVATDITASNGRIHAIDTVVLPFAL